MVFSRITASKIDYYLVKSRIIMIFLDCNPLLLCLFGIRIQNDYKNYSEIKPVLFIGESNWLIHSIP